MIRKAAMIAGGRRECIVISLNLCVEAPIVSVAAKAASVIAPTA